MMATEHDAFRESGGLYVLGALDAADRTAFEAHLAGCSECVAEVRSLREVAGLLPYGVPQVDPPASLRDRVLQSVAASAGSSSTASGTLPTTASSIDSSRAPGAAVRRRDLAAALASRSGWLAMAAVLVVAVALGFYDARLRQQVGALEAQLQETTNRLTRTEQQLAVTTRAADGAQLRLAVLTAPDLRQVTLAGQRPAPRATGRGFWSRTRGLVFAATELPPVAAGQTYQLWYLTRNAPVSAGLFTPDRTGTIAAAFDPPPAGREPTGLAVSIEPEGGVPAPTGAIYLAGTAQ